MIEESAAVAVATELLGRPRDDSDRPWSLKQFPEGWLIVDQSKMLGALTTVIERSSGRIVHFPSSIAPGFIMKKYASVVAEGREGTASDFRP